MGPTWQVGHMGPLGLAEIWEGEESLWDSNSPPHTELGWEGVKLGLLPPKERWGRSPSWTPTPQGWPATLATYIKEGVAPQGDTPAQGAPPRGSRHPSSSLP